MLAGCAFRGRIGSDGAEILVKGLEAEVLRSDRIPWIEDGAVIGVVVRVVREARS